jgi:hypothetical protein
MIKFAEPDVDSLADSLIEALSVSRRVVPLDFHERVKGMYSWLDVAKRTETVYNVMASIKKPSFGIRLTRYFSSGTFSGTLTCFLVTCMHLFWRACQLLAPDSSIELCPDIVLSNSGANDGASNKTKQRRRQASGSWRRQVGADLPPPFAVSADDPEKDGETGGEQQIVQEEMYPEIELLTLSSEE